MFLVHFKYSALLRRIALIAALASLLALLVSSASADGLIYAYAVGESHFSIKPRESATLEVGAAASEGTVLTYEWTVNDKPVKKNNSPTYTTGPLTANTDFGCMVSDNHGTSRYVGFYIMIDNGLTISPSEEFISVPPNTPITLTATASCTEGKISYKWYSSLGGLKVLGKKNSLTVSSVSEPVTYHCIATDQYSISATASFHLSVDNELKAVGPNGESKVMIKAEEGTTPQMSVTASCRDGKVSYEWFKYDPKTWSYNQIKGATKRTCMTDPITADARYGNTQPPQNLGRK